MVAHGGAYHFHRKRGGSQLPVANCGSLSFSSQRQTMLELGVIGSAEAILSRRGKHRHLLQTIPERTLSAVQKQTTRSAEAAPSPEMIREK